MIGCIIFYNDGPAMLERALKSLIKHGVKEIIGVDGAYLEFPANGEDVGISTDGCMEIAQRYCSTNIHGPMDGWQSQMQKRNEYLKRIPEGEYFFILDADEKLTTNVTDPEGDAYSVWMVEPKSGKEYPSNRLFKKYADMEYRNRHSAIYRTSLIENPDDVFSGLINRISNLPFANNDRNEPIILEHYLDERPEERKIQDSFYMDNRLSEIMVPMRQTPVDETDDEPTRVKHYGKKIYNGWLCDNIKPGQIFTIPRWRYKKLQWDYGPFRFRKFNG